MKMIFGNQFQSNLSKIRKRTLFIFFSLVIIMYFFSPAESISELGRFGDFSINLIDIERKEDTTNLHFVVVKIDDTNSAPNLIPVILTDDHLNEYSQSFKIDFEGELFALNNLPKGFCYTEIVTVPIPKIAPIEKISVGEKEMNFGEIKLGEFHYLQEHGDTAVTREQTVQVGKWLSFAIKRIDPALRQWELLLDVESKEYNPLPVEVKVGVQHENGTISWTSSQFIVPAASKYLQKIPLPIPSWTDKGYPCPRALLLIYYDLKDEEQVLKVHEMAVGELPVLVGQGLGELEDKFIDSYQQHGGRTIMGDPLDWPSWLAGGNQPKDGKDLLVQTFPSVSQLGTSAILWDIQKNAEQAYIIHGKVWETYLSLGGPDHWLGYPNGNRFVSSEDFPIICFEGGYIGTTDGISFEAHRYPTGKIVFRGKKGICTIDTYGNIEETKILGYNPVWSPDGTKIVFISAIKDKINLMDADGKNMKTLLDTKSVGQQGRIDNMALSPDGSSIVCSIYYIISNTKILWRINLDSGNSLELSRVKDIYGFKSSWSPDKSTITFSRREKYGAAKELIYLIDSKGGSERILTEGSTPAWLPDGNKIVFISNNGKDIYTIDKDGSNLTLLLSHHEAITKVSYSPDGKWLTFSSGFYKPCIYFFGPGNWLFQLNIEGEASYPSWYQDQI
jgi:WD40 repeat protein